MENLINQFENYLIASEHANITIKLYIADLREYLGWQMDNLEEREKLKLINETELVNKIVNADVLSYFKTCQQQGLSESLLTRKLASLRKFYIFCNLQGLCQHNPLGKLSFHSPVENKDIRAENRALVDFENRLINDNLDQHSREIYLGDIRQFFDWIRSSTR